MNLHTLSMVPWIRIISCIGILSIYTQTVAAKSADEKLDYSTDFIKEVENHILNIRPDLAKVVRNRFKYLSEKAPTIPDGAQTFSSSHFLNLDTEAQNMQHSAHVQREILQNVSKSFKLGKTGMEKLIPRLSPIMTEHEPHRFRRDADVNDIDIEMCPYLKDQHINCETDHSPAYRTLDGSCNNLNHPAWGKSFRPLTRFLPPDYADGIDTPRADKNGDPLPNSRMISSTLHTERRRPSHMYTALFMSFGQFIDHDVAKTAITKFPTNQGLINVKCGLSGCETEGEENRACHPISVPLNDPDFHNQKCLVFVRTMEVPRDGCQTASREQLNQITAWLDASHTYGSTQSQALSLRDQDSDRGKLKMVPNTAPNLKPVLSHKTDKSCMGVDQHIRCFNGGDGRLNEQVGLTTFHIIFARYHNNVEEELHRLNPHWGGERLYQESRRIVIAVQQYIIYNEYLPITLGPEAMYKYRLGLLKDGYYDGYNPTINGQISNAFQTSAFRFGHSNINAFLRKTSSDYTQYKDVPYTTAFFRPLEIYKNTESPDGSALDNIMLGMVHQRVEVADRFFSKQVSRSLHTKKPPFGLGHDLPAINIHRGRDHGLPGYNRWREWCGLKVGHSFFEMPDIDEEAKRILSKLYKHVNDTDLFTGGMAERHVQGGSVGPTFACILGQQFYHLRAGDRHWFETNDPDLKFTPDQLAEIRKIYLSTLICETSDTIHTIQRYSLLHPLSNAIATLGMNWLREWPTITQLYAGDRNCRLPCKSLPQLNLTKWQE